MTDVRNWLKTLWPASYKGVPFFFESDSEDGGRGLVVHSFVNSDKPFVEDLGEDPRHYSGHAYVHGDDVDAQEVALKAAFASRGAGPLVLPLTGMVLVRLHKFKRKAERDRAGVVSFEVSFVREGAAGAIISLGSLANSVFGAVDALQDAAASAFADALDVVGAPDFVVAAATDGVTLLAGALDAVRITSRVDVAVSASIRDRIADFIASAPDTIAAGDRTAMAAMAGSAVSLARDLSDGMAALPASTAMSDVIDMFAA
ncbi:MAG: hypothetical protein GC182_08525 [Rhodopseudomonas sp.]|nr:hypothetical protein [Rhodopseudomonas sp.]